MPSSQQLEHYAEILLRIGLNVQPGQPVSIRTPIEAAEFVHILVTKAYEAGASTVNVDWQDPLTRKIRLQLESEDNLVQVPNWVVQKTEEQCDHHTAFLIIDADNPSLLADVDPKRLAMASKAMHSALKEVNKNFMEDRVTWLVCSIPTSDWAVKMFPNGTAKEAVNQLWDAIFMVMRMDQEDPVLAWNNHLEKLETRAQFLNEKRFQRLHYRAPGTDLTVELPAGHIWMAARSTNGQGHWFVANMPTEEVYTLPKRDGVNGVVSSTMPLAYNGVIIDGIELTFENGRIIHFNAKTGVDSLQELIETDEGSHYLGEVALVPVNSPIAKLNRLFYNTLFDENASCHLAIGEAYPTCLEGGTGLSKDELVARGANDSLTHVDFMIGSDTMDIDGILENGTSVVLFRKGQWVI
jgi:aminopeptidase